ncbi:hypothetical protein RPC_4539 [Rhodopseudomonas palustris BisB18]|uniref:Uncharacterized protein n=1 Tax=Rhodopseudomonas palustris (strain BisB18) TaxID=316056 RepID=Q20XS5_RHOPB
MDRCGYATQRPLITAPISPSVTMAMRLGLLAFRRGDATWGRSSLLDTGWASAESGISITEAMPIVVLLQASLEGPRDSTPLDVLTPPAPAK